MANEKGGRLVLGMADAEYFSVISEQDPDFSSRVCKGLTMEDLDAEAVEIMRKLIADKQKRADTSLYLERQRRGCL